MGFSRSPERRGTKRAALMGALGKSLRASPASEPTSNKPANHTGREVAQDAVNSVIEGEIFPAILSGKSAGLSNTSDASKSIPLKRAREFARMPLRVEPEGLIKEVKALLDEGVPIDAIYDELLAPAARSLGEMWEEDSCDFVDVTMGLWRLQEVMREISAKGSALSQSPAKPQKKAVFLPMPGDQHFMGPQMLEDVFTRAGWDALSLTEPRRGDILGLLGGESFDLIGLTLSRDCPSAAIRSIIDAMRLASRNPDVIILVGGRMINLNPAAVAEVGADGTGADARTALMVAERLVQSPKVHAHLIR